MVPLPRPQPATLVVTEVAATAAAATAAAMTVVVKLVEVMVAAGLAVPPAHACRRPLRRRLPGAAQGLTLTQSETREDLVAGKKEVGRLKRG